MKMSHLSDAELLDEALLGAGVHHGDGRVNAGRNEVEEDERVAHALIFVRVLVGVGDIAAELGGTTHR